MESKTTVLLAAYNDLNFIREMYDSIIYQKDVYVAIYESVDKSTDQKNIGLIV